MAKTITSAEIDNVNQEETMQVQPKKTRAPRAVASAKPAASDKSAKPATKPKPSPEELKMTTKQQVEAILGDLSFRKEEIDETQQTALAAQESADGAIQRMVNVFSEQGGNAGALGIVAASVMALRIGVIDRLHDMSVPEIIAAYKATVANSTYGYVAQCGLSHELMERGREVIKARFDKDGKAPGWRSDPRFLLKHVVTELAKEGDLDLNFRTVELQGSIYAKFFTPEAQPDPILGQKDDILRDAMTALGPSLFKLAAEAAGDHWENLIKITSYRAEDPQISVNSCSRRLAAESNGSEKGRKPVTFAERVKTHSPHVVGLLCAIDAADNYTLSHQGESTYIYLNPETFEWTWSNKEPNTPGYILVTINSEQNIVAELVA